MSNCFITGLGFDGAEGKITIEALYCFFRGFGFQPSPGRFELDPKPRALAACGVVLCSQGCPLIDISRSILKESEHKSPPKKDYFNNIGLKSLKKYIRVA